MISMENKKEFRDTIKLVGEINVNTLNKFLEEVDVIIDTYNDYISNTSMLKNEYRCEFPRITIDIASYGGCTNCGTTILEAMDRLRSLNIHVDTHATFAYSMAFIIYVYGERRSASKFVKFMNHQSSAMPSGFIDKMEKDIAFYDACDRQFDQILLERTEMGEERVNKPRITNSNDWIFWQDAVDMKIINYDPESKESQIEEFSKKLTKSYDKIVSIFSDDLGVDHQTGEEILHDLILDQPLEEDDDEPCNEISEDCYDCHHVDECFNHNLSMIKSCMEDNNCEECKDIQICNHDRAIMLEYMCDDIQDCDKCDNSDLCEVTDFETIYNNNKEELNDSECQAPHCSGDCCNCNLCDIEVEEDIEPECDCDGSCDSCICDKDNTLVIDELDNVPNCYGEVSPHDEECLSCSFLNACCVKTKAELESCKEITKQEEGIGCDKCEFKEECKEQLEFCDKVLNITNN